jgi:hypothetical protein
MTRRRSLAVVAVAAAGTVALAAGIAQGSSGSDGDTQVATIDAAAAAADVRLCPGAAPVDQLDPGDTVALTGRSEDGAWLQLRSPTDEDERVWIDATLVVVTTTPEDLPIVRCGAVDLAIELIGGAELVLTPKTTTTTTTSTTAPATGASTTVPAGGSTTTSGPDDPTTTAAPTPGGGPSPTSPPRPPTTQPRTTTTRPRPPTTTTTTAPPDRTPPSVSTFTKSRSRIFETGGAPGCPTSARAVLRATVTDASGVADVRLIWRVSDPTGNQTFVNGNTAMQHIGGGVYEATVGPFGQIVPQGIDGIVRWRVQATDGAPAGNQTLATAPDDVLVTLVNC